MKKQHIDVRDTGVPNLVKALLEFCTRENAPYAPPVEDGYYVDFRINGIDAPIVQAIQNLEQNVQTFIDQRAEDLCKQRMQKLFATFDDIAEELDATFDRLRETVEHAVADNVKYAAQPIHRDQEGGDQSQRPETPGQDPDDEAPETSDRP